MRAWLSRLADDADARDEVIRTTLDGALASVRHRVGAIAREVDEQLAMAALLRDEADTCYADALREVDDGVRSGSVLRGEVLARWQEFVGTGELTRSLEQRIGRFRDRVTAFVTGRPAPVEVVEQALETSLQVLVRAAADGAAERTAQAWRMRPAGRALLHGSSPETGQASPQFSASLEREIRDWQSSVLQLVAQEGGKRRTVARWASFGTNATGLALMLAVFAHTGGLTGGEVLVAGGTSAASQKILEAVFGDSAVRTLAARARANLLDRVEALLAVERARFDTIVDDAAPDRQDALGLRAALEEFERARRQFPSLREVTR